METAGLGAFLGVVAYRMSPGVALVLMLGLIFGGCFLQLRAEKQQKAALREFVATNNGPPFTEPLDAGLPTEGAE